ncbi:MAG TPA: hypothetical protein VIV54_18875 [Burkholderiales bacterium]
MAPHLKIATHHVPDAEAAVRNMRQQARELTTHYGAITGCRFSLSHDASLGYEARLELLFPQHQVIVNGGGAAAEQALKTALAAADAQLKILAQRDATVAPRKAHAKAA